jgi:putative heme-binding domain-containing protein
MRPNIGEIAAFALSGMALVSLCIQISAATDEVVSQRFRVPDGFVVEKVAGPPLVRYPLFASFDDRGRLYVAEGTGTNLAGEELAKKKLGRIVLLEDTDGDGKFDTSTVFADQLVFPQGVLWHAGAVYTASHPSFWRLEDTKRASGPLTLPSPPGGGGEGRVRGPEALRRTELLTGFKFNGNGCDIHGPFLGPDGRLYWTDGRHGYKVKTRDGHELQGLASRVWRCRTDGTDVERLCGGGFDNPVQLAFSPEGDLFGTMDQGSGDALLHYVEGAVFPMEHPCLKEFAMTGPLLGPMKSYPAALPAGLCGFMRYRSAHLGKEYQDTFFATHYVQHKIVQSVLTRDGATFRAEDRDFLTTTDHDVRITDVVEDADGSLLFIDMGGWFTYGFPGNPLPKPEKLGAIYRIRRAGAPRVVDPWGKSLKLATRPVGELTPLLDDPRPKVRDQVVALLAKHGEASVKALEAVVRNSRRSVEARRNAVWSLCRMESGEARAVVRLALADPSASVRQAAVHAVGLQRDVQALAAVRAMIAREEPPLRLKAAEALGRMGRPEAVPNLLVGLAQGGDRFLQHALIYALIRIDDRASTLPALVDRNPRVRRGGLIALDQMPKGALTRELVVPLLDTDDTDLQQTALAVISRHEGWGADTLGLLRNWLGSNHRTPDQERSLVGALLAFSAQETVQNLVAELFADPKTTVPTKMLLLSVLSRCRLDTLPSSWLDMLRQAMEQEDRSLMREAVAVVKVRNLDRFDTQLATLSRNDALPAELRIAALECLAPRRKHVDAASFALLTRHLSEQTDPLLRIAAARTLGASALDGPQLTQLAKHLTGSSMLTLRLLLPAFARSQDDAVGKQLAEALARSPVAEALSLGELDRTFRGYPREVRTVVQPLREKLVNRRKQQAAYISELSAQLSKIKGDGRAGREVFFSRKVGCCACHRAATPPHPTLSPAPGGEGRVRGGGQIGPDLSQIGRFRSRPELLESIVFPSLVIAPEFRSYRIGTKSGSFLTGLIVRESNDAIDLRTPDLAEVRVARKDIEAMEPSDVSLMPDGQEKIMSRQELADLLEFLLAQR